MERVTAHLNVRPTKRSEVLYEIARGAPGAPPEMRVSARILADADLLGPMLLDQSLVQLVNVTTLPGVVDFVIGMPDMHEGYGFPVGGVAATLPPDGAISPGGIGFDINCGVRLLSTRLRHPDHAFLVEPLIHELSRSIPTGFGRHGRLSLEGRELDAVLEGGCPHVVRELGLGLEEDIAHIEARGCLEDADASMVSARAKARGHDQLGTLGGGNHFLEVQVVDEVFDDAAAAALGLSRGAMTILLHTGSRGLGHQVCTDAVREMDVSLARFGWKLPDRQLACAPLSSYEGQRYFRAMSAAANFAWANRQVLTHRVRQVMAEVLRRAGADVDPAAKVIYDVAHNIAKLEEHRGRRVCVHRKGATRAFGPSSPELPEAYRGLGQPIFIPGSMGTASFVLLGTDEAKEISFASTCHGAGRSLSRAAAKRRVEGHVLRKDLESRGIVVRCPSNAELAEEAPSAYKDVEHVVDVVARAGVARKVARLKPLGVMKG